MQKFKLFLRFDREEKWLEHMANQGWMLFGKSLFYDFRPVAPGEKTIRIDYREFKSAKDFSDYCALFEDSGWQHIAGTKSSGAQYFLKIKDDSTEDIFSDVLSRAGRYKRLSGAWFSAAVLFAPFLTVSKINTGTLFAPREWYLTPGLWELEGFRFWRAFLFETPFALMRGISWLMPVFGLLLCIGFAVKASLLYRSETKG